MRILIIDSVGTVWIETMPRSNVFERQDGSGFTVDIAYVDSQFQIRKLYILAE